MNREPRLIVVSNRLPVTVSTSGDNLQLEPSCGGLVTALTPALECTPASWIGWTGTDYSPEVEAAVAAFRSDYSLVPVYLTPSESELYYAGFSNRVLWPLFHDQLSLCKFDSASWAAYQQVNEKFADIITANTIPGDLVWIHDYHLMLVGAQLRRRHLGVRLAYFHHIPFASPDIFANLPASDTILRSLLRFDTVAFQTSRDRHNFIQCVRAAFGRKLTLRAMGPDLLIQFEGTFTVAKVAPVSIDAAQFTSIAVSPQVTARVEKLKSSFAGKRVLLGVDRLDYTKGIQQRLASFRLLLEKHPHLREKVVLLQLVIPSRERVPEYEALRLSIERQVAEINGTFGQPDWTPVVYLHRSVSVEELVSWYRFASVMLVTSLKDGMNLVAKEFCVCKPDDSGALVLSKFAGAAEELRVGAFLVNPNDREQLAQTYLAALNTNALDLNRRMSAMRQSVVRHDVFRWISAALDTTVETPFGVTQATAELAKEVVA